MCAIVRKAHARPDSSAESCLCFLFGGNRERTDHRSAAARRVRNGVEAIAPSIARESRCSNPPEGEERDAQSLDAVVVVVVVVVVIVVIARSSRPSGEEFVVIVVSSLRPFVSLPRAPPSPLYPSSFLPSILSLSLSLVLYSLYLPSSLSDSVPHPSLSLSLLFASILRLSLSLVLSGVIGTQAHTLYNILWMDGWMDGLTVAHHTPPDLSITSLSTRLAGSL